MFWLEKLEGVFVGDANRDLGGEFDRVLEGEANKEGSSSSMVVGLTIGESSTIFGSSWLLVSIFGRSNRTVLGFFVDEEYSISESLYAL